MLIFFLDSFHLMIFHRKTVRNRRWQIFSPIYFSFFIQMDTRILSSSLISLFQLCQCLISKQRHTTVKSCHKNSILQSCFSNSIFSFSCFILFCCCLNFRRIKRNRKYAVLRNFSNSKQRMSPEQWCCSPIHFSHQNLITYCICQQITVCHLILFL